MACPDYKARFRDAITLLNYGYSVSRLYEDENQEKLQPVLVKGGVQEQAQIGYEGELRYLDITGKDLSRVEKLISLPEYAQAPLKEGMAVGEAVYMLDGKKLGSVPIIYLETVEKAVYKDYLKKAFLRFLL